MDLNEKYCSRANILCVILTYSLALVLEFTFEGEKKCSYNLYIPVQYIYWGGVIGMWEFVYTSTQIIVWLHIYFKNSCIDI